MNEKVILISGCSSGIGYCVAKGLKQRGYRVFATARKQKDVEHLRQEGLESLQLDLANSVSIHYAIERVLSETDGKIYGLFNNGGFGQPGAIEDVSRDALRQQFEVNVLGTQELTNLVIPVMRRHGEGRIIQNSSVLGFISIGFRGAYNASKFALEALSDAMRQELYGTGIYVSLIEPGPITSRFRQNAMLAFKHNIQVENSFFKEQYLGVQARLAKYEKDTPFTLGPNAVLQRVVHALEAKRPRIRYPVTKPTYVFAFLKRVLPDRTMDSILKMISDKENE